MWKDAQSLKLFLNLFALFFKNIHYIVKSKRIMVQLEKFSLLKTWIFVSSKKAKIKIESEYESYYMDINT